MHRIGPWHAFDTHNRFVYTIPFRTFEDAKNFARLIGKNRNRFSLLGCHRRPGILLCDLGWEVVYRIL